MSRVRNTHTHTLSVNTHKRSTHTTGSLHEVDKQRTTHDALLTPMCLSTNADVQQQSATCLAPARPPGRPPHACVSGKGGRAPAPTRAALRIAARRACPAQQLVQTAYRMTMCAATPPQHAMPTTHHRVQVPAQTGRDRRQLRSGRCMHSDRHQEMTAGHFRPTGDARQYDVPACWPRPAASRQDTFDKNTCIPTTCLPLQA